ncbi:putative multi-domain containing protein [Aduncisulcus paluster]|uniref:Multi-domain containing protein n=1 Tax=Aduncisulcus paluster TaxID=2918883 RepID=A0ABQ5K3W6_9EUKA|nr:putative multi-domain containing protein [Aduncisulcus paluster]|eukprot:gnl/Carplike_NY0171/4054_a5488_361.p1 GENE.gnl/Carplike_NY0171/4054_a5488_361~~gnl/Carplike_NY0171/4054_a5488_361.p1  ORF type:complete len:213 (-),score=39.67 gnl/Carplike_NY0171/4054_a5488_361:200-838(-)
MPTVVEQAITLKGSSDMVSQFFSYAINAVLYMRGVYPAEMFEQRKAYDVNLMVATDQRLNAYLSQVLEQVKIWLSSGMVESLVLVLTDVAKAKQIEKWTFNIEMGEDAVKSRKKSKKSIKQAQKEIQALMRQIVSSVTFLPLISSPCSFDLLIYCDKDAATPEHWEESGPCDIVGEKIQLAEYSTGYHRVTGSICYTTDDDDEEEEEESESL